MNLVHVDHLVYAAPDLERAIDLIRAQLGVRPSIGGRHPAWGTHNALVSLGSTTYLEIIAPDPDQPAPEGPRPFGLDDVIEPRLVSWAAGGRDLARLVEAARAGGVGLGAAGRGSRLRADGVRLTWTLTDPRVVIADGLVPIFIDWGDTPHPARSIEPGGRLADLRGEHPEPGQVRAALDVLGLDLPVAQRRTPAIVATISTAAGLVLLR